MDTNPYGRLPITLTKHARERGAEMHLSFGEIHKTIREPEVDYDSSSAKHGYQEGQRIAKRGRISCVYCIHGGNIRIITILWNTQENYERQGK